MLSSYNFISTNISNISSVSSTTPKTSSTSGSPAFANILSNTLNISSPVQRATATTTATTNNFPGILNQTLTTPSVSVSPPQTTVNTFGTFGIYNPTIQGINTGVFSGTVGNETILPKFTGSLGIYNPIRTFDNDTLTKTNLVDFSKNYFNDKEMPEIKPLSQDSKSESTVNNNQIVQVKGAQITVTPYTPAIYKATEGNIARDVAPTAKSEKTNTTQPPPPAPESKKTEEAPKPKLSLELVLSINGKRVDNIREVLMKAFVNKIKIENVEVNKQENISKVELTNAKIDDAKKQTQVKDFLLNLAKGKEAGKRAADLDGVLASYVSSTFDKKKVHEQELEKQEALMKGEKEDRTTIKKVDKERADEEAQKRRRDV